MRSNQSKTTCGVVDMALCEDQSLNDSLKSCIADTVSLARATGYPIPRSIEFWEKHAGNRQSIALCGPVGSNVGRVFEDLTGVAATDAELSQHPIEVDSIPNPRWLSLDGTLTSYCAPMPPKGNWVKQIPGHTLGGVSVSAILLDAIQVSNEVNPEEWLGLCGLTIVVSPITAFLGKRESTVIKQFANEHRNSLLLITKLQEAPVDERDEILSEMDRCRIAPLRRSVGDFPVIIHDENGEWIDHVRDWSSRLANQASLMQPIRIFEEWTGQWKVCLREQVAEEHLTASRLADIRSHLELQLSRYSDIFSKATAKPAISIAEQQNDFLAAAQKTAEELLRYAADPLRSPELCLRHIRDPWECMDATIHGIADHMQQEIADEWLDESVRFCRVYAPVISERALTLKPISLPNTSRAISRWDALSWDDIQSYLLRHTEKLLERMDAEDDSDEGPPDLPNLDRNNMMEEKEPNSDDFGDMLRRIVEVAKAVAERISTQQKDAESSIAEIAAGLVKNHIGPAAGDVVDALTDDTAAMLCPHATNAVANWAATIVKELNTTSARLTSVDTQSELAKAIERMSKVRGNIVGRN